MNECIKNYIVLIFNLDERFELVSFKFKLELEYK